jgi:hypothetical protein
MDNRGRITRECFGFDGMILDVRIVRCSWICRLLLKEKSISFGHTIYLRGVLLTQAVLRQELAKIALLEKNGWTWKIKELIHFSN